jgi:Ca2+-binding RTX toxin-like protein
MAMVTITISNLFFRSFYFIDNVIQFVSAERISGTPQNDNLTGTPANDRIIGSVGNDTLIGLAGIDERDGGRGIYVIEGTENDDYLAERKRMS